MVQLRPEDQDNESPAERVQMTFSAPTRNLTCLATDPDSISNP